MNPDRWESAKRLFHDALERPPVERDRFVHEAAAGDIELRDEVIALLAAQSQADQAFHDVGGSGVAAILPAGTRLGAYEIHHLIGVGGMGEVYHARDTRLRRDVAIKILPSGLADDAERLRRFEREAQLLAALNHPHIASIYGFEEARLATDARRPVVHALVLELVEGPTLADRIAGGPLAIGEALAIAGQIADALDAAHERGIVHRDLKPANVKLTPDGAVKVLDFGLAKLEPVTGTLTQSPTISAIATRDGVIAGTAPYMSPEQARGKAVDKRADIWAFGCVLYELLTGSRAFSGETTADVVAAIVGREPDWSVLPPATPASVSRLLRRCLEKDVKRRLRDIGDARVEIDEASASPPAVTPVSVGWSRARLLTAALGVAVVASVVSFLVGRGSVVPPASETVRVHRLTDWAGVEETPAISPDGRAVAFVSHTTGSRQIWVRLIAGGPPLQLTRDAGDHVLPRWSPDSSAIVYYLSPTASGVPGAIWEVPALGGPARRIADSIGGVDVSHDGGRIAFFRFEAGNVTLAVAARDGSNARPIAQLEAGVSYLSPRWSPNDQLIAYQRSVGTPPGRDVFVVEAEGGTPRPVTRDATLQDGFAWSPDSSRVIVSSARTATIRYLPTLNLWSVRADGSDPRQLTFGEASYLSPDVNRSGAVVATRRRIQSDIWRIPVDGPPQENVAAAVRITRQTSLVHTPSVAPDGREVAYVSDGGTHANIWVHSLVTGESRKITDEQNPDLMVGLPLWSPAGGQIAYFTALKDSNNYLVLNPDGSNRRLLAANAGYAAWSADGRWLYYIDSPGGKTLKKMRVDGGDPVLVRSDTATRPALSPDGRTLYYVIELPHWTGGSDYEIRAANPEAAAGRVLTRILNRRAPRWAQSHPVISPDGQWLALPLLDDPAMNLWAVSTTTGEMRQLTDFDQRPISIVRRVSWAPDGRSIFAAIGEHDADIVLIEGLRP